MFLSFKDRDTPFSTTFIQLLMKLQVKSCKFIMLRYFTIASVVFPSSRCSISVVFNMFARFASVCLQLQTRHIASIHLRGRHEREKWKIGPSSTFRLQKCLCLSKYKCKEWITVPFENLGNWWQLFASMWQHLWQRHPAGTWAIHPKSWWIEVQNTYYMIQTNYNWRNMKSIPSII